MRVSAPAGTPSRDSCLIQELRDLCRFPAAGFPHDYYGLAAAQAARASSAAGAKKRMPSDVSACRYISGAIKRLPSQAKGDAATCNKLHAVTLDNEVHVVCAGTTKRMPRQERACPGSSGPMPHQVRVMPGHAREHAETSKAHDTPSKSAYRDDQAHAATIKRVPGQLCACRDKQAHAMASKSAFRHKQGHAMGRKKRATGQVSSFMPAQAKNHVRASKSHMPCQAKAHVGTIKRLPP